MRFFLQIFIFLISLSAYSQLNHFELDSLLRKEIKNLKEDKHGIVFLENLKLVSNKNVIKDFENIRKIILLMNSKNTFIKIKEGKSEILILRSTPLNKKIIQIKSTAYSDISHYEISRYNFFISSGKNKIYIEFDENGINSYEINKRKIFANREVVLELGENYNENEFVKEVKKVKEKYLK